MMYRQSSPVDRLPEEILSYIFTLGVQFDDIPKRPDRGYLPESNELLSPCHAVAYDFPWMVAAVTKHWRYVALSTSELWSKIFVSITDALDRSASDDLFLFSQRTFLSRSGNFSLDVLIDARDPEWDFTEFDSSTAGNTPGVNNNARYDYAHPFSVEHMRKSLNMILPHIHRCRSIVILTDRWLPMQLVLTALSTGSADGMAGSKGIPRATRLETLSLMRCNEFQSYTPRFSPEDRAGPVLLPFANALDGTALPRLKKLTLSGVHVAWPTLPLLLPCVSSSFGSQLRSLELSYHQRSVRPRAADFRLLLERCSCLEKLAIKVSGPVRTTQESVNFVLAQDPIHLPFLRSFTLGYDDVSSAVDILRLMDAPELRFFGLEDSTFAAALYEVDADDLMRFCALKSVSLPRISGLRFDNVQCNPIFPKVNTVLLHAMKATSESFRLFFTSLPGLNSLTLSQTSVWATNALRPSRPCDPEFCPCPYLDQLVFRGQETAMHPAVAQMLDERTIYGTIVRDVQLNPVIGVSEMRGQAAYYNVEDVDELDNDALNAQADEWEREHEMDDTDEDDELPDAEDTDFPGFLARDVTQPEQLVFAGSSHANH